MATRICGGDFESGGQWEDPADDDCDFSDFTRRLCLVGQSTVKCRRRALPIVDYPVSYMAYSLQITGETASTTAAITEITSNSTSFGVLEVSTTLGLLEQLLPRATGNTAVSSIDISK